MNLQEVEGQHQLKNKIPPNITQGTQDYLKARPFEPSSLAKDICSNDNEPSRNLMPRGCTALWNRNSKTYIDVWTVKELLLN